jgi:hypothetical protein
MPSIQDRTNNNRTKPALPHQWYSSSPPKFVGAGLCHQFKIVQITIEQNPPYLTINVRVLLVNYQRRVCYPEG